MTMPVKKNAHLWARDRNDWYMEPPWVSRRLFERIQFTGSIEDPAAGFGRIVMSARRCGLHAEGFDLIHRPYGLRVPGRIDFMKTWARRDNIASNPPFKIIDEFTIHAIDCADRKVALLFPIRRVTAAGKWIKANRLPLSHVLWLTPRPSMPPGRTVVSGMKVGQGEQDFAWLIFDKNHHGEAVHDWLHRDE